MGYILFITICVGSLILFKLAELKDNKLFLVLGVVALSLGAGLRNDNVGLDTYQYVSAFKTNFSVIWLFKETGFREISRLLMNAFSGNTTCLFLLYAAVTNALILYRLWDFRKDCSYSYMAFLYITLHYINTLNIMRQYIAIAIVFFATRFLEKKGYMKFLLAVLLASVFHSSALLGLFFFFVYYWKIAPKKQKKWMLFPLLIAIPIVFIVLMKTQLAQITNYFSQKRADVNATFIYRIIAFGLILALQYSKKEFIVFKGSKKEREMISISRCESIFCIAGLATAALGMFFSFLSRLGLYYLMFEIVFWGEVVKRGKSKQLAFLLFSTYAIYVFVCEFLYNGSGIFPYGIHWI